MNLVSPCHSRFFSTVLHSFLGASYTPKGSISKVLHIFKPLFCVFSPFLALFRQKKHSYPPPAKKTATEAHRRPNSPAAPSRPSALRPVACPVARPLGLAPLWARGRGVCSAPFGQLRPAAVPPFCAPCSSLPSAPVALLARFNGALCADGREGAACSCVLVPPGLRRRRPPRRRFAVRWRGRAVSGARGGGAVAPAPAGRLSVVGLVGLAAGRALSCVRATGWRVAFAPWRRGRGAPPAACVGGFEAFGFASAALARSCGRARGVFFPPNNPPFFPVALARRDAENFS